MCKNIYKLPKNTKNQQFFIFVTPLFKCFIFLTYLFLLLKKLAKKINGTLTFIILTQKLFPYISFIILKIRV